MKNILFMLMALGLCFQGISQTITIQDELSGEKLDYVILSRKNPNHHVISNAHGQANISALSGAEAIEIRLLGYQTRVLSYQELMAQSEIVMTPSITTLDQMIISATRWNQVSNDVPSKITTISARETALENPQTAADMLGTSGEVFIQKSQQGGGSPMIRGFATNRLLYTVDGVRMNTAIFRGGNIQNVISLDPFATEKTEVFFGPGSVIYGSDAIGGVMSFKTLRPELSVEDKPLITGKAVTRYSSANNEKTGHFDVNIGWKKWASVTSFTSYDFDNLRMGSYGPEEYLRPFYVERIDSTDVVVKNKDPRVQVPSGYEQTNLMQKLLFRPNENWEFEYGFHYSITSDYARYDRHVRYRNGLPRYGEWSYGPQEWMMNNLSVTHHGHNAFYDDLNIQLAQQHFEESRIDRNINKDDRFIRIEKVDAYSLNLDLQKHIGEKGQLFYGAEAVQNDVNSIGRDQNIATQEEVEGPSRYPQSTWASYAAYLSYQHHLNDAILLQAGARYNQYQLHSDFDTTFYAFPFTEADINNGAITGSLGAVFKPTPQWAIRLNGSTGFRSPNVDDVGKVFDSEPGSVVVPNPDLEAEYAYNAELGIAKVFGDFLEVEVTGYYTILQNAMVRRDYTLNGEDSIMYDGQLSQVQAIQNAAVTTVYGVQAGFEIKLPSGFGFTTRFNYQKGEEELDNGDKSPSRHAAPWFGISRLSYRMDKLTLEFYSAYSGERAFADMPEEEKGKTEIYATDENGDPYSPSWATLNVKALYSLTDHLGISAGVENLTDLRYRPYSSGIVAPGRNFILALRATF